MASTVAQQEDDKRIELAILQAPGTELLYDTGDRDLSKLQHVKNGDSHVLLVPQPSLTDPNDPLSWPRWKKYAVFGNAVAYSFLGSVTGPIMAAMMEYLAMEFNTSLQRITYANGATLICQGIGNIFWMPFTMKLGRRPVYIVSNTTMGIACIWLGVASNSSYTNLLVARAFLGIFEAPIECIVPSTVRDIFYLHHRGNYLSLYGLSVLGGNELGPMFSAIIFQALGSKWAFWIVGFFVFAVSVTMLLWMPETLYLGLRPSVGDLDSELQGKATETKPESEAVENTLISKVNGQVEILDGKIPKKSFVQQLALVERYNPEAYFLKDLLRPFVLCLYPTVLWACAIYGLSLSWNVILGSTVAQLMAPQYNFDPQAQGLVFLAPFIGSLIGTWLCGIFADKISNYYTIRNKGIREPEMRLPTCIIAAVLTFFGTLIAALTYNYNTHWIGPVFGFGTLSAGAQMGATLAMNYALDCHAELSVELMVTIASLKSLIAWIFTWVINDWVAASGMMAVFMTIAAINVAVYLVTTIPLYIWGKQVRWWIARSNFLGRAGLQ